MTAPATVYAEAPDFAAMMGKLAPRGPAWPTTPDSVLQQVYGALGYAFGNVNDRANFLLVDSFPATSVEILPAWESSVGLPDTCTVAGSTVAQRQLAVVSKLIGRGGRTAAYFIALAAALGFSITITEFAAFRADVNVADDACNDDSWAFVWQVNVIGMLTDLAFYADSSYADEPLDLYETGTLECRLRQAAPASKTLIFTYQSGNPESQIGNLAIGVSPI